jgi:hypothetical protein
VADSAPPPAAAISRNHYEIPRRLPRLVQRRSDLRRVWCNVGRIFGSSVLDLLFFLLFFVFLFRVLAGRSPGLLRFLGESLWRQHDAVLDQNIHHQSIDTPLDSDLGAFG